MKRLFDIFASFIGLIIATPVLLPVIFLVWYQDKNSPFYIAPRVGKGERLFNMVKLRSMVINADRSGVDSTSANDSRITSVGNFIRKYKLDEITQLWNVLLGDMSLVGPRPNIERETTLYTIKEKRLFSVKPGITDFASIVFSDEGKILENCDDPDLAYNQLIRPWKSRLGLFYINNQSFILDLQIICFTIIGLIKRDIALNWISCKLDKLGAEKKLVKIVLRNCELQPYFPPGSKRIVTSRYI